MSLRARYNGKKARDRCKRAENALNEKKRKEKRQEKKARGEKKKETEEAETVLFAEER